MAGDQGLRVPWLPAVAVFFVLLGLCNRVANHGVTPGRRFLLASGSEDEYVESLQKTVALLQARVKALEKQLGGKVSDLSSPASAPSATSPEPAMTGRNSSLLNSTSITVHVESPEKLVKKAVKAETSLAKMVGLDASSLLTMSMFGDWGSKKSAAATKSAVQGAPSVSTQQAAPKTSAAATITTGSNKPATNTKTTTTTTTATTAAAATAVMNDVITGLEHIPFAVGMNPALEAVPGPRGRHSFNTSSDYQGPFFYMYELPEEFWWRWPNAGTDCSENGYVGHEHAQLSGLGPAVLPEDGLFLTWHFSMFSSLFNRIKRSKRRTLDPEKASLFIIPYDLGLDGYLEDRKSVV